MKSIKEIYNMTLKEFHNEFFSEIKFSDLMCSMFESCTECPFSRYVKSIEDCDKNLDTYLEKEMEE